MRARIRGCLVAGACVLWSGPAAAGEETLSATAVHHGAGVDIERTNILTDQLAHTLSKRYELVRQDAVRGAQMRRGQERADKARDQGERGAKLLLEMRTGDAVTILSETVKAFETDLAFVSRTEFVGALMSLAVAQALHGDSDAAKLTFARAVVIKTDLEYDPSKYPPTLEPLFQQAKKKASRGRRSTLVIRSEPEAEAFVDGVSIGQTPTKATRLLRGVHYLTLLREGYLTRVAKVRVARRRVKVSLTLEPDESVEHAREALPDLLSTEPSPDSLGHLAATAGTDMVLLCRVVDVAGQLIAEIALIDTNAPDRVGFVSRALPQDDSQVLRTLLPGLVPKKVDTSPAPPPPPAVPVAAITPPDVDDGSRIYHRWWFWAAVGAATVAAVAIPVAMTSGDSSRPVVHEF